MTAGENGGVGKFMLLPTDCDLSDRFAGMNAYGTSSTIDQQYHKNVVVEPEGRCGRARQLLIHVYN